MEASIRNTLAECTVLLKKDGKFPLKEPCKIAAFGSGVRHTIKGGTGSGEVNSRYFVNIEEGLADAGFTITSGKWLEDYEKARSIGQKLWIERVRAEAKREKQMIISYSMGKVMPEPEFNLQLEAEGDTAIYVVSRISGEGNDRAVVNGDIKLSKTEIREINACNTRYDKFMLVLNVGGVVDLSEVAAVKNILILSQLGVDTGNCLADILLGKQNPSGKLTTTWASFEEYFPLTDFDDIHETRYTEGIYVGYRYFDSFNKKTLFPFGYGLSYTEFETSDIKVTNAGENITITGTVKNIGEMAGKEIVEAYVSAPFGKLDKAYQDLAGFAKTPLIEPGFEESFEIKFKLSDIASYDEKETSYFLDAGDYILRVGKNSRDTKEVAIISLNEMVKTFKVKNVCGQTYFTDLKSEKPENKLVTPDIPVIKLVAEDFECLEAVYEEKNEISPELEGMSIDEIALLTLGDFSNRKGLAGVIGESSSSVCGAAGESCTVGGRFPNIVMADGPAGLRLAKDYYEDEKGLHPVGVAGIPESMLLFATGPLKLLMKLLGGENKLPKNAELLHQYCTAIPIGTAIAQSFNLELAAYYGDIVGKEMEEFKINLWLAPALNIHRSIRCGRNFEYYSEDPLVSGLMAAAITKGVQTHKGCGTTIKHFAANNKELNRYCNNSKVSERAMREIYLKGFGICIRDAKPLALMSSYNLLNGTHTAENPGLIKDVLRSEFGFEGIVMTDWIIAGAQDSRSKNRTTLAAPAIAAGQDIFMPGGKSDYKNVMKAINDGTLSKEQVKISASRIINMANKLAEK